MAWVLTFPYHRSWFAQDRHTRCARQHLCLQTEIKLQAFLSTQFTEFIWLDTDNLPLMAPEEHFDSVEYSRSHAVFWSDLNKDHPDNAIWRYLARACNDVDWPAETGQIVYDKRGNNGLNYAVLHISNHMMDDAEFYGNLLYGDKDTFVRVWGE